MGHVDAWSEAVRKGQVATIPDSIPVVEQGKIVMREESKSKEENQMEKIYTIVAVQYPSLLESQAGKGAIVIARPSVVPARSASAALAQFGAQNAEKINAAPAGLIEVTYREGV